MRELFLAYYTPSDEEFAALWQECTFSFDANMLLNIYRYSQLTRGLFCAILEKLNTRIWISHQAALEYHRNRLGVISEQNSAYQELGKLLDEITGKAGSMMKHKRHPFLDAARFVRTIQDSVEHVGLQL